MDGRERQRRRVLVVVSAWCPAMIADMQRARMLAWELPKLGWDVEILAPRASEIRQDVIEPDPAGFFAPDTRVHEVGSVARRAFEALGSRTHAWRTWLTIRRKGRELLRSRRFDLVYFTTTTFVYFSLGPRWYRETEVPYVLDFHDPWVKANMPHGRRQSWRAQLTGRLARRMERDAVVTARGIVSVSPGYIDELRRRYATSKPEWLAASRNAVIPFGAREGDLAVAVAGGTRPVRENRGEIVLRYVGAGGAIMVRSFDLICRAVAALREQSGPLVDRVRIELYGTTYDWKPGDPKELQMVAKRAGVSDLVREKPDRVSYRRSLELLHECDGGLVLGVDDAGYMPSKLFSYSLSAKPLLVSFHRDSPAFAQCHALPDLAHVLWFDGHESIHLDDAVRVVASFLDAAAADARFDRQPILQPFLAPEMARRHAELFNACVDPT